MFGSARFSNLHVEVVVLTPKLFDSYDCYYWIILLSHLVQDTLYNWSTLRPFYDPDGFVLSDIETHYFNSVCPYKLYIFCTLTWLEIIIL